MHFIPYLYYTPAIAILENNQTINIPNMGVIPTIQNEIGHLGYIFSFFSFCTQLYMTLWFQRYVVHLSLTISTSWNRCFKQTKTGGLSQHHLVKYPFCYF